MVRSIPMNIIVAVDSCGGIGRNGNLPWCLRGELARFGELTTSTTDNNKKNAVIMGRKVWQSIPSRFRPLKNRLNIVLSSTMEEIIDENVIVARSFESAINLLQNMENIETIWNIGGRNVYELGLKSPLLHQLYITRVEGDFSADVFFPEVNYSRFIKMQNRKKNFIEMVGRKKRSNSTKNNFADVNVSFTASFGMSIALCWGIGVQQYGTGDFGHSNTYRGQFSNVNSVCRNGSLVDSEYSTMTTTFHRRSKQYNNHFCHKNQQSAVNNNTAANMNGNCIPRSASRGTSSASAGSIVSVDPDEDGFYQDQVKKSNLKICVDSANSDLLLTICKMKHWQRVEAIAEVIQCLNAYEQRYIGSCVETAVRSKSLYLRQYELRYNDACFLQNFVESASYIRLLELAFPMLCLLHSTNRPAANAYMRLIDRLYDEFTTALASKSPFEKEEMLDSLLMIVSAARHHAAFSVEHKIKLENIRTYLEALFLQPAAPIENQGIASLMTLSSNLVALYQIDLYLIIASILQSCKASTSENDDVPVVISRLDAEIEWSDMKTSYIVRTADQIADLHNRLLDSFPNEAGAQTGNPRVLPYLNRLQPSSILGYIRALPDLPARVLVCPIVRDFFYPSRLESCSLSSAPQSLISRSLPSLIDLKKPVTSSNTPSPSNPPLPETPVCHPSLSVTFYLLQLVACPPFSMTNVPPPPRGPLLSVARPLSLLATTANVPTYPSLLSLPPNPNGLSCCNCAGRHPFAYCTQPTMLQIIVSGEYRIDYNNITTNMSSITLPSEMTGSIASINNSASPPSANFSSPPPAPNSY
ncbi:putative dihydrofolate reductase [Dirofilaria immitis]|nr:putative dihydrofolate reductase [Dirofilaria immitis]